MIFTSNFKKQLYTPVFVYTKGPISDSEGYTDESYSKPISSAGSESVDLATSSSKGKGKLLESTENSKFNQFSELNNRKKELTDDFKNNNYVLATIKSAEQLDKKLPEEKKNNNSYINELIVDFPEFFDADSGNTSIDESLKNIRDYITSEQKSLKSELEKVTSDIKNLTLDSTTDDPKSSKRVGSEFDEDTKPSAKKTSRSDGGNDNNSNPPGTSGPSDFSGSSGPSDSSSSSGPSSLSDTSHDSNHKEWLNIIIMFIRALFGDDSLD